MLIREHIKLANQAELECPADIEPLYSPGVFFLVRPTEKQTFTNALLVHFFKKNVIKTEVVPPSPLSKCCLYNSVCEFWLGMVKNRLKPYV